MLATQPDVWGLHSAETFFEPHTSFPMHLDPLRPSEPDPHIIDSDRIEALEVDNSENSVRTIIRLIDVESLGSFEREELDKLRRAFGRERARFFVSFL